MIKVGQLEIIVKFNNYYLVIEFSENSSRTNDNFKMSVFYVTIEKTNLLYFKWKALL